ncbi:hypothetical protein ETB97_010358 [Aspergillus alliaceus]|uniref:Uncharacterized protein n=1 Tax=Petromyces alliaceus TaxID=209559 RepID=A0A5N6FHR2_PETAA|nr:uncharacterized protein BDW43DRAFT_288827 [Aspergillus alliaceus]KAB8229159.1 hypothetical protein BDW43DRAFT_288827 [Aspergillus alliaceus]KAE8386394.1 hypothetical protein BDV23DRAFT_187310 [Aspergillus alliaceus]KAF5854988.1 hypothetical protein ETB97_010358 [Aspergillus burnettii]
MRFIFIAALALVGSAFASPQAKLPAGQPCKQDGSLGVCDSGLCVQLPGQPQGVCK